MRFLLAMMVAWLPNFAQGQGFAIEDFKQVIIDVAAFEGGSYDITSRNWQIVLECSDCDGIARVLIQREMSHDNKESWGNTSDGILVGTKKLCSLGNVTCPASQIELGKARGWMLSFVLGPIYISTAVLSLDGDVLSISTFSSSSVQSDHNMRLALRHIAAQIVEGK